MCGIFGIHLKKIKKLNLKLHKDIKTLSLLSKNRGQDTFGLLLSSINQERVFKINSEPSKIFERADYTDFLKFHIDYEQ